MGVSIVIFISSFHIQLKARLPGEPFVQILGYASVSCLLCEPDEDLLNGGMYHADLPWMRFHIFSIWVVCRGNWLFGSNEALWSPSDRNK